MLFGRITRFVACFVIFSQVMASVVLLAVVPAPSPVARASEPLAQLEASDLPADELIVQDGYHNSRSSIPPSR